MFAVWTWFSWIFVYCLHSLLLKNYYIILSRFSETVWQTSLSWLLFYATAADFFMEWHNHFDYVYFLVMHVSIDVVCTSNSIHTQRKESYKGMTIRSGEPLGSPLVTFVTPKVRVYFLWEIWNILMASKFVFKVNVCQFL